MKSVFSKKDECCGCTACKSICPTKAIKMKADEEGFLYPEIIQELCIDCGLCFESCAFQNGYDISRNLEVPNTYGVKHLNNDIRMESRSGGMFTALSDLIIDNGGVVYGVGYNNHFKACHKKAINKLERNEFRGSKYVQSDLNDVFVDIKNELIKDNNVMFTGTPCQVAGLSRYLDKKHISKKNLLLCDIICHGTPSPKLFQDYIEFIEKKYKGTVVDFEFRNKKKYGWVEHVETYVVKNKTYSSKIYTNLFYEHSALRPSCYNCKYTNMSRPSDITLADFWGVDEIFKEYNDNKGVSLIFINTEKGKILFDEVKDNIIYKDCTGETFIHPNLKEPTKISDNREQFWNDYYKKGFKYISKKYCGNIDFKGIFIKNIRLVLKSTGILNYLKR